MGARGLSFRAAAVTALFTSVVLGRPFCGGDCKHPDELEYEQAVQRGKETLAKDKANWCHAQHAQLIAADKRPCDGEGGCYSWATQGEYSGCDCSSDCQKIKTVDYICRDIKDGLKACCPANNDRGFDTPDVGAPNRQEWQDLMNSHWNYNCGFFGDYRRLMSEGEEETASVSEGEEAATASDGDDNDEPTVDGDTSIDPVCYRTMALARELHELKSIVHHAGRSNAKKVVQAAKELAAKCEAEAEASGGKNEMGQCSFYVESALEIDPEILESAWLLAFGDNAEQHRGCGKVVTAVNENMMRRRADVSVRRVEVDSALRKGLVDAFVVDDSSGAVEYDPLSRRLLAGASAAAAGGLVVLGHLCRSFDPKTFNLIGP